MPLVQPGGGGDATGLIETGGPTVLEMGAVTNGQVLQRVGNEVRGVNFVGGTPVAYADLTAPLAVANPGAIALATGIGNVTYVPFISDGVNWRVLGGKQLIFQRNAVQTLVGNAAAQVFTAFNSTVLGNLLTLTRSLRFEVKIDFGAPAAAAANSLIIRLGGQTTYSIAAGTARSISVDFRVWPDGALNALRHYSAGANNSGIGASTGTPPAPAAVDVTASFLVEFLSASANTDLGNLRNVLIWLEGY